MWGFHATTLSLIYNRVVWNIHLEMEDVGIHCRGHSMEGTPNRIEKEKQSFPLIISQVSG